MFEFHVSRVARDKYQFDQSLFKFDGNVVFANFLAARIFSQKINQTRDLVRFPEQAVSVGDINALGLIDEILHLVVAQYRRQIDPDIISEARQAIEDQLGATKLHQVLLQFTDAFPPQPVLSEGISPEAYLEGKTNGTQHGDIALEELLMLWITNENPAVSPFSELFDDHALSQNTNYHLIIRIMRQFFEEKPPFGPDDQDLIAMLRSPAVAEPYSLAGQLDYIRRRWGSLIGGDLYRLLTSLDLIQEEQKALVAGPGPTIVPGYDRASQSDIKNFSPDSDWMPRTVMIAKNTFVWLYQLSQKYNRTIEHLDQIPGAELDQLAEWGFNGLWLIGLWERSSASRRIKQLCGNPEAVASAYSLKNYDIAEALGGAQAYQHLKEEAKKRGIRLASDMVPNHMGIDSDWVLNHPDWFISLPYSPFPSYTFNGPDLSPSNQVGIFIEDHYYDRTDAAVVFKRLDRKTNQAQFIYHGNDGTSMPWNDTAQLNYLKAKVREAVIQTILHVARMFPIIRFDAAMTLAKKHYQRLWFPQPGTGGGIPSRSEHAMPEDQFDAFFPHEFWREVVERVTTEVPDTLLLAEAFWLMEGYFVRTLGMHRVYNSAFMNMLRNEENDKYRQLMINTLEFDPDILKRYVNFMNNPDEKTAVEQFGTGDKYFGICTLMATLPGLPMFGHGQIQGYAEKYGMEYYRPYWDETPNDGLIERHQREIFPLLKRRELFSGVDKFSLFDFITNFGQIDQNVYAYTNGTNNSRSLVVYHNHFGSTSGWVHQNAIHQNQTAGVQKRQTLVVGLNLHPQAGRYVIFRDARSGMAYIRSSEEIRDRGIFFTLDAYQCHVFLDFVEVDDTPTGQYQQLNAFLSGRGVSDIDAALQELMLAPVLNPLHTLIQPSNINAFLSARLTTGQQKLDQKILTMHNSALTSWFRAVAEHIRGYENMDTILREAQNGFLTWLQIPQAENRFPFPGSTRFGDLTAHVQAFLGDDSLAWITLLIWNDLRMIGYLRSSGSDHAQISRSWFDEWGLGRGIQQVLRDLGFDQSAAQRTIAVLRVLIAHQNWVTEWHNDHPQSLLAHWLEDESVRSLINLNRYHGILYFNQQAFDAFLSWMMTIGFVAQFSTSSISQTEALEKSIDAFEMIQTIRDAAEDSDFQIETLFNRLSGDGLSSA